MNNTFKIETRTIHNTSVTISWHADDSMMGAPWTEHDGHGIVTDWTTRDKEPGERVLCQDRHSRCFYDVQETTRIAKRDGWGLGEEETRKLADKLGRAPTPGEIIAQAVENDFRHCYGWANGEWCWCGFTVEIDGPEYPESSLWGIASLDSEIEYFESQLWNDIEKWLKNELEETQDAACRDIVTAVPPIHYSQH